MTCPNTSQSIDANFTGLRVAFEVCIGELPGEDGESFATTGLIIPSEELGNSFPTFHALEPNSYSDFGSNITNTPRSPINAARQREKGVTTDLDATAGFQVDFTLDNLEKLLPTYFFAAWRRSNEYGRSSQDTGDYTTDNANSAFDGTGVDTRFDIGALIIATGSELNEGTLFDVIDNTTPDTLDVTPAPVDDTTLDAGAHLKQVGVRATTGDIDFDATMAFPALTSTTLDFTTLGLIPGQWIYVGDGTVGSSFVSPGNNGFMRVKSVAANRLEIDKTQNTPATETGTGLNIAIFFGDMLKNEADPTLIKKQSVQFERSLAEAGFEYVTGCIANTLTINISTADKVTVDLAFIGTDGFAQPNRKSIVGAQFPTLSTANTAFNTSSDFSRIRLADQNALSTPLFAFITELTLTINNNASATKAVAVLGNFDITVGDFVAEGNVTAYFSDVAAVQAVRNNADVTFDFALVNGNTGWIFDVPLIALGDGRLSVEKDQKITLPLSLGGARDPELNTTLIAIYFPFLPAVAAG